MNIHLLRIVSIGYLLIPNLIFYVYWTRPLIASMGVAILIYAFVYDTISKSTLPENQADYFSGSDLTYVGIVSLVLTLISGVGGICYQTFDYWGHNTKFFDLFTHEWPLRNEVKGTLVPYYFGYYVMPAVLFKMMGKLSDAVIFSWTFIGICLGIAWLYIVLHKRMLYVLLCICLGDTPYLIRAALSKLGIKLFDYGSFGIEVWSNFENLIWVPNQFIPSLIVGGMLVYSLQNRVSLETIVLPVVLIFWWAIFPAFTSSLFAGILIVREWIALRFRINWLMTTRRVILPVIVGIPILFLLGSHQEMPISGFLWNLEESYLNRIMEYTVNIGFNLFLFIATFRLVVKNNAELPAFPFYLMIGLMALLPVYRMGKFNDFLMRGLMPCLVVIGLYLLAPLAAEKSNRVSMQLLRKTLRNNLILLLLFSSSLLGLKRTVRALSDNLLVSRFFFNGQFVSPYSIQCLPFYLCYADR